MERKKYFHLLTDDEVLELSKQGRDWNYVREHYKQPKWCSYHNALDFNMGCWSLTDKDIRKKINEDYCKTCPCFTEKR